MDKFAIRERINYIKNAIASSIDNFVLNKEVKSLRKEMKELQAKCNHEFVDGICTYCGKEEE